MWGAGDERMNSDSPSTCFSFDSAALGYSSASLCCVLLVGFSGLWWRQGDIVRLDCPISLSDKADNLLLVCLWIDWSLHLALSSSPTSSFVHWHPASLPSILNSTHFCKFAIWVCQLSFFFFFFSFCYLPFLTNGSHIGRLCMCAFLCALSKCVMAA